MTPKSLMDISLGYSIQNQQKVFVYPINYMVLFFRQANFLLFHKKKPRAPRTSALDGRND